MPIPMDIGVERATERVFTEMLPELAGMGYGNKSGAEALALDVIRLTQLDIQNKAPQNNTTFWGTVGEIASQSGSNSKLIFNQAANHKTTAAHNYDDGTKTEAHITNTGRGALLVADDSGKLVVAHLVRNRLVEKLYGDMAYPITKKLVLAMLAERAVKQGADWGEGYTYITSFLRRNNLIGEFALPALGMATLHGVPFTEKTAGMPRDPLAYSAGSAWMLNAKSTGLLLDLPSFNEHYGASSIEEIDWLAGLADFTVARAAAELVAHGNLSTNFPNPWQSDEWFGLAHDQINAN